MTLETFDLDAMLTQVTTIASSITGIRTAYNYTEWPDAPPGAPVKDGAYHLTALPGEVGTGMREIIRGSDLAEYEIDVPLYVVVAPSGMYKRAREWARPFFQRYYDAYRLKLHLNSTVAAGSALISKPSIVTTRIPFFPGYDDFYTIRHILTVHAKGASTHAL